MNRKPTQISRRELLIAATAASCSTFCHSARAAEPIAGRSEPKFKFSLAAYSYRSLLQAKGDAKPAMTLHDFIDDCAAMQLEGAELTSYYMPEKPSEDYLIGLRSHCFRQGLAVSGTAIRNDFGVVGEEAHERELAHMRAWIDAAAVLHAPAIRIFAGKKAKAHSEQQSHELMVEGIKQSCDYAASRGIYLALENHGGPTASSEGLLRIVKDVDSPWLGVNLDTGNFREGGDPYAQMQQAAPYAVNVQVKVALKSESGAKEEMDFARVAQILKAANYRGFVVLEYEESGDVRQKCREFTKVLRDTFLS